MLGLQFGWFRCEACGKLRALSDRAWRSSFGRGFGVCSECYAAWDSVGRRCPRCWAQVKANQVLAYFPEWSRFGHFECGGALLA
jgi:predicted amidophosphoribosyltransferase